MRLIDADEVDIEYRGGFHDDYVVNYNSFMNAPTIDIVRCGECKYAEVSVSPITGLWCTRFGINDMAIEDDDFCSYGEREGE